MSKIDNLIKELCPNGVKKYKLSDIVNFENGKGHEKVVNENGKYVLLTSKAISTELKSFRRTDEQLSPLFKNDIAMVMSDLPNGRALAKCFLVDCDDLYTLNQRVCRLTNKVDFVNEKYLYYILNRNRQLLKYDNGVDQTNLKKDDILKIEVFIPPIEVQEEIVRILDKFGELEVELEAKLEAELKARKSQYEFWRGRIINMYDSKNVKLSDMAKVYDGTHSTPNYQLSGIPFISVENISNIYGSNKFISVEDFQKYKIKPQINDVFMTRIGSIGKCSVFDKQVDLAYYVSLALIRPKNDVILPKYLKYVIESSIGKDELYKRTLVHAVPIKVNKDEIGKIVLPVPSIDDQKRIISKLDKFESLTESITLGLLAEIELRRQQYEYFRNKLLTFEEFQI